MVSSFQNNSTTKLKVFLMIWTTNSFAVMEFLKITPLSTIHSNCTTNKKVLNKYLGVNPCYSNIYKRLELLTGFIT